MSTKAAPSAANLDRGGQPAAKATKTAVMTIRFGQVGVVHVVGGRNSQRRGRRAQVGKTLVASRSRFVAAGPDVSGSRCCQDASAYSLHVFLSDAIAAGAIVHTDGWGGYVGLTEAGWDHRPIKQHWRDTEACKESFRARTARSPTSRPGWRAPTTAPPPSIYSSTSTSLWSVTTADGCRWPPSRRCLG